MYGPSTDAECKAMLLAIEAKPKTEIKFKYCRNTGYHCSAIYM